MADIAPKARGVAASCTAARRGRAPGSVGGARARSDGADRSSAQPDKRIALVIGNGAYKQCLGAEKPDSDARAVAAELAPARLRGDREARS